ncbi:hypothetical protein GCM10027446_08010 [Angustibacter peucedani]
MPAARSAWDDVAGLLARGCYREALAVQAGPDDDAVEHELLRTAHASGWRQLGDHDRADELDGEAVERCAGLLGVAGEAGPGPRLADALADAWTGWAADAVGRADLSAAVERWRQAGCVVELADQQPGHWRRATRLAWVRCEVALLDGDPVTAREAAGDAVASSAPSDRHRAKSLLFSAVAHEPSTEQGAADLEAALVLADRLGLAPLVAVGGPLAGPAWAAATARCRAVVREHLPTGRTSGWWDDPARTSEGLQT